jgi:hypothetical protein
MFMSKVVLIEEFKMEGFVKFSIMFLGDKRKLPWLFLEALIYLTIICCCIGGFCIRFWFLVDSAMYASPGSE